MSKLTIGYSVLAAFKSCPQKFINDYFLRLQPKNSGSGAAALNFGSLIHFGIEIVGASKLQSLPSLEACYGEIDYLTSGQPPALDSAGNPLPELQSKHILIQALHAMAAFAASQRYALCAFVEDERRSLKHALLLMTRYVFHHYPESLQYETFEQFLTASLGTINGVEVLYEGTVDGTTSDALVEHKTTSYLNTSFLDRINPSDQVTGYLWLLNKNFPDRNIMKTVFDGISTSGYGKSYGAVTSQPARWTINTKPDTLFLRTETWRTQDQLNDWEVRTKDTISQLIDTIRKYQQGGLITRRAPDACTEFNSTCKFISLCRSTNAADEAQLRAAMYEPAEPWIGFKWTD